jgi:hydroxyacylglutathione hydrolase
MQIERLCALSDNYIFVLIDEATRTAAVVDPAEASPVLAFLDRERLSLTAIFNTHHHGDHVGGNRDLLARFPGAVVHGSTADRGRIPGQSVFLENGARVRFGPEEAEVLFVPGHTRGHIAYYFAASGELFCGDTLFAGGCGRLFEGTPAQMLASLARLKDLPDTTRVWCAHEYTLSNLRFALTVEGDNPALRERYAATHEARERGEATVPSTIALERQTNPFLRWESPALQTLALSREPVAVFAHTRALKDRF